MGDTTPTFDLENFQSLVAGAKFGRATTTLVESEKVTVPMY